MERGARVRFPPPLVFLGCLAVAIGIQHFVMPLRAPLDSTVIIIAGSVLAIGGVTLLVSARTQFLRTGQNPTPWSPSPELIAQGPYRFTRNPMYVGFTLFLVGLGVAANDLWICVFALVALAIVHVIAVVKEEAYLEAKFGESYLAYKRSVRRYL